MFIQILHCLGFITTSYFSSLYTPINLDSGKWIELMCHPSMRGNSLYDHVEGVVIRRQLFKLKNYTQLL